MGCKVSTDETRRTSKHDRGTCSIGVSACNGAQLYEFGAEGLDRKNVATRRERKWTRKDNLLNFFGSG